MDKVQKLSSSEGKVSLPHDSAGFLLGLLFVPEDGDDMFP
jgi:hypothetical protein